MVKHSIKKGMGTKGSNLHVLQSTRMLWLNMYQISSQEAMLLSENIGGPNPRTIIREYTRIDAENFVMTGSSIIHRSKE